MVLEKEKVFLLIAIWNASYIRLPCGAQSICQTIALEPSFCISWVIPPVHLLGFGPRCQAAKVFLGQKKKSGSPWSISPSVAIGVICSPACGSDTVAATCQNCFELSVENVLGANFCLKFSFPGEILINGISGYPVVTTEIDPSFLSASLGLQKVTSIVKDMSWR